MATYHINLEERGLFFAHVEDANGNTIMTMYENDLEQMIEDGFIRHSKDINGLSEYLVDLEILEEDDKLVFA